MLRRQLIPKDFGATLMVVRIEIRSLVCYFNLCLFVVVQFDALERVQFSSVYATLNQFALVLVAAS